MRPGSTNSTSSTNRAVRALRRCEVFRSVMKQLGKQAGARTIRASPSLDGRGSGGSGARLCGTRWGAVARARREKMPHAGRLGKRMLNGHCQSAPGFGIGSPRCGAPPGANSPENGRHRIQPSREFGRDVLRTAAVSHRRSCRRGSARNRTARGLGRPRARNRTTPFQAKALPAFRMHEPSR
jgi:hypothetical protein